jgi:cytochrome b pre-mRNA-processing protein 3
MLSRLFRPRPAKAAGAALFHSASTQARHRDFYTTLGVEDRIDARFELYTLHVALLNRRLRRQGEFAAETSQVLFDTYLASLDDSLRELGVGDLSVGKKMRKLGEAFYGRAKSYDEALADDADAAALGAVLARTVFGDDAALDRATPLADYVRRAEAELAAQSNDDILGGHPVWPSPQPDTRP